MSSELDYTRVITRIFVCLRVRCVDTAWTMRGHWVCTACNVRVVHALYARVMLQSLWPVLYLLGLCCVSERFRNCFYSCTCTSKPNKANFWNCCFVILKSLAGFDTNTISEVKESFKLLVGDKSQNILSTKTALYFRRLYRIRPIKLINHSTCTDWEIQ